jgi:hypothetical protein
MSAGNGDGRKTICLGMPHYGSLTPGAAAGFYLAHRADVDVRRKRVLPGELTVNGLQQGSSLLAQNFNVLWSWALNEARKGRCDYFAMIHSDIEPEHWWLDKAVGELEAKGLDVLGVVAPIKDQRGRTSTALDNKAGDTWRVHCRLTMKEVYRLPETFTGDDLGYPLLINTGLWVCRFREEWARKVHFTVNDRICFDPAKGVYFPQVEPEDWFVSRLFHELGLKVGCTRKVALGHRGEAVYGNTHPWGEEFDREYVTASVLDAGDPGDWFPADVAGWLTEEEGRELARLAAGKAVLEIGAYCGRSTICLARTARNVQTVDPFDGRGTPQPGETLATFRRNLGRYGVADKVAEIVGTSAEALPRLPPVYDLVFIDGAHDEASVAADAALAAAVLRPGGLIAFHDYGTARDPGVKAAVDEFVAAGGELLGRCDRLAVVRPPAAGARAGNGNGNGAGNGEGACDGTRGCVPAR